MHFKYQTIRLAAIVIIVGVSGCASNPIHKISRPKFLESPKQRSSVGLNTTLVPGSIIAKSRGNSPFIRITDLSKIEYAREAARLAGQHNIFHVSITTAKIVETRHRPEIESLLSSFGSHRLAINKEVIRVVCTMTGGEILDIRDESLLFDMFNRPYLSTAQDDALSNALKEREKVMICSSIASCSELKVSLLFAKSPFKVDFLEMSDAFHSYAANEGLFFVGNAFNYDPISKSATAVFKGQITVAGRFYPLTRLANREIRLGDPLVLCRSSFVLPLFAWPYQMPQWPGPGIPSLPSSRSVETTPETYLP